MNQEDFDGLKELFAKALELQNRNAEMNELRFHGLQVCVIGMLRMAAKNPEIAAKLAPEIEEAAERMHGVALGYPVTETYLQQRDDILRRMLPTGLKELVRLPTQRSSDR